MILGPGERGLVVGDRSDANTVRFNHFNVDVDPSGGNSFTTEVLVEINDAQNAVVLEGYTNAPDGLWDVVIGPRAGDSYVDATSSRRYLRVKREAFGAVDFTKFDPHRHERMAIALYPDSLEAFDRTTSGSGEVTLRGGAVEHRVSGSATATVQRSVTLGYDNISFQNPGVIQTHVAASAADDQEGWLV